MERRSFQHEEEKVFIIFELKDKGSPFICGSVREGRQIEKRACACV